MPQRPTREGIKRVWSRRWFRRITYCLAAGALGAGGLLWMVQRPFVNRWVIARLDGLSRENTGLGFRAQALRVRPLEGRIEVERFAWGEDLLQGDRLRLEADLLSLFSGTPRLRSLEVDNPRILVDRDRLARIHFKPRPDRQGETRFQIDRLLVQGGQATFLGGGWGLPDGECSFRVYGQGLGPNQILADLRLPRLVVRNQTATLSGSLRSLVDLNETSPEIRLGELRLGASSVQFHGALDAKIQHLSASVQGGLDLGEVFRFALPARSGMARGRMEFKGGAEGRLENPSWNLAIKGREIAFPEAGIHPGTLDLGARGSLRRVTLKDLHWASSQGDLQGGGEWQKGKGSQFRVRASGVSLLPAATWARVPALKSLTADASLELSLPGDPWAPLRMDALTCRAEGVLRSHGAPAGGLSVRVEGGEVSIPSLSLALPEFGAEASGKARIGRKGLLSLAVDATGRTDAREVAQVLHAWKIPEFYLDMAGSAQGRAHITWDPVAKLQLRGSVEAEAPRWERAVGDRLRADVRIEDSDLWIEELRLEKGEGLGTGRLWLTWRDLPPGEEAIDMCYEASRLPIEEGMKASGLKTELTDQLAITGIGSGWVRIHGPYDRIRIEASGMAESASVVGIQIPHVRADMDLDLAGDRLGLKDIRVAQTEEQLGSLEEAPSGELALRGSLDMDLKRGTWQGGLKGRVDSLPLGLPGPRFQAQVDLRLEGPWSAPEAMGLPGASLEFQGGRLFFRQLGLDAEEGGDSRTQSLEGLHGRLESGPGGIQARVGMSGYAEPILSLDAWSQGKAMLGGLDVHIGPQTADTRHLAASLTRDLLVDGRLDLQMNGRWDEGGLRWGGRLDHFLGRFDGFEILQEDSASLEGDASQASLDLNLMARKTLAEGGVSSGNTGNLHLSGSLPFSAGRPMALRLKGQAELANLKAILDQVLQVDPYTLLGYMRPSGTARFDLHPGGTYASPTLDGDLSMKGGRLVIQAVPQSVEDLDFKVRFQGREILLAQDEPLRGRLAQGNLQAWGKATWDFGGLSQYNLSARLDGFEVRDALEGLELHGRLDANLQGDGDGGILKGTIEADRMLYQAEINLREFLISSSLGGSGVVSSASPDDPLANIALDLDVKMSTWECDTNLLKVQGTPVGILKVQGNLLEPGFKGVMEIVPGGRITNVLAAGDIILEEGFISFPDPAILTPHLNLTGRIDISPYVVNLKISGPLDLLEMKMSSIPSLRQDEILAILIDPSLATTIGSSAGQGAQANLNSGLASTSTGLLTTLALAELQDQLRRSLHLDRVNVVWRAGTAGNSKTDITLGTHADLFGLRVPVIATRKKVGDLVTMEASTEWRPGAFVIQLGVSQSGSDKAGLAGEIRHTWVPRW